MLSVVDEMCSFFFLRHSDKRQVLTACGIPSRGCAQQLDIVEEMAGGRQEARNREASRRKDGTTFDPRTPRKGRLRPVKLQLIHADWQDVDDGPADCWRRGGGWPNSHEPTLVPSPSHFSAFRPTGYMLLLVLSVVDEMCSFFFLRHSDKRQVLTACAESLRAGVHCS